MGHFKTIKDFPRYNSLEDLAKAPVRKEDLTIVKVHLRQKLPEVDFRYVKVNCRYVFVGNDFYRVDYTRTGDGAYKQERVIKITSSSSGDSH